MKNFNWDEFKAGIVAVHCNTEEKANDFLKQAFEHGVRWHNGDSMFEENYYYDEEDETCYRLAGGIEELVYVGLHETKGYKIVKWEIDSMKEFTEEDLKIGMLIKNEFGYGMIVQSIRDGVSIVYKNETWGNIDFLNITEVWGYSYCSYAALRFSPADRELLYERKKIKKMTVKEICKELGYDVEIVKE